MAGDGTGSIDRDELGQLMQELCVPLKAKELEELMADLDTDQSGTIEFEEFFEWYKREADKAKSKRLVGAANLRFSKMLR